MQADSEHPTNAFVAWLRANNLTYTEAHKKLTEAGHEWSLERIRQLTLPFDARAWKEPSFRLMAAIHDLTEGAVSPNDWASPAAFPHLRPGG